MQRESFWLRWNRLSRHLRADVVDWCVASGVQIGGRNLEQLTVILEKWQAEARALSLLEANLQQEEERELQHEYASVTQSIRSKIAGA